MVRRIIVVSLVVLIASLTAVSVFAESSFSIAPPPIADAVFDAKEWNMKVRGTYLTMKGTDPAFDFKLNGYGVDVVARKAVDDGLAINGGIGVIHLDGKMGGGTLTGVTTPITVNVELQPFKNDVANLIVFLGPQLSISSMELDTAGYWAYIDSYIYGYQVGMQMGFNIKDTVGIDVFLMTLTQSGSQDTYSSYGSFSSDIPSFFTTSFGIDFVYLPWGVALSSILQEAGDSDSAGMKTQMYQISWSKKF